MHILKFAKNKTCFAQKPNGHLNFFFEIRNFLKNFSFFIGCLEYQKKKKYIVIIYLWYNIIKLK